MAETSIVQVDQDGREIQQHEAGPAARSPLTTDGLLKGAKLEEIRKVAGQAMNAERLIKLFAMQASRQPLIRQCSPISVLDCMTKCAELNLFPGTVGSVYLIPFRNGHNGTYELQFILGYRGMMTLARRSGLITTIDANVVRDGDVFEWEYGLVPVFRHKPIGDQSKPVTHAWALARFRDGGHQLSVMTLGELEAIRNRSRARDSGPWKSDTAEMQKKTVLRRLCKYLPLDVQAAELIDAADRAEFGFDLPDQDAQAHPESENKTAPAVLADRLQAARDAAGVVVEPAKSDPEPACVLEDKTPRADNFGAEMGSLMDTRTEPEPVRANRRTKA